MKLAFICWTPLHIINILNVVENYYTDEKKDLYVYAEFNGASEYYQRLKDLNVFNNVLLIDPVDMGNSFDRKLALLTGKSKMLDDANVVYDQIFIQGENYFSKILFSSVHKKNADVCLNYIEDGIGAYLSEQIFSSSVSKKSIINRINPNSIFAKDVKYSYVYRPDLLMYKKQGARKIPAIKKNSIVAKQIRSVFELETVDLKDRSVYFDQPLLKDGFGIDEAEVAKKIRMINLKRDLLVKLHPRSISSQYNNQEVLKSQLPFEVLMLENDFSNTVLLSPLSTIAFSPLLMLGKPMKSIFLPKLLLSTYNKTIPSEKKLVLEKLVEFCNSFNKISEIQVLLPETWEELERILR